MSYFDNHDGPFEAVVEPSASGVRVTFNGWEEHPFVATAARIRMVYHRPGADRVDVVAEAMPGGKVRIRPADRPPIQGKKVVGPPRRPRGAILTPGSQVMHDCWACSRAKARARTLLKKATSSCILHLV